MSESEAGVAESPETERSDLDKVQEKVHGYVRDVYQRLSEQLKYEKDVWSTRNGTLFLSEGREIEIDVRVRIRPRI